MLCGRRAFLFIAKSKYVQVCRDQHFKYRLPPDVSLASSVQDLKANESRLKDINKVAGDLESEGLMAEEVQAVQQQVSSWPVILSALSFIRLANPFRGNI